MAKNIVINKRGARVRMNDAALRIAEKHFGISRSRPLTKEVPIELLQLPSKIEIIKAKPIPAPLAKAPVIEIVEPPKIVIPEISKAARTVKRRVKK